MAANSYLLQTVTSIPLSLQTGMQFLSLQNSIHPSFPLDWYPLETLPKVKHVTKGYGLSTPLSNNSINEPQFKLNDSFPLDEPLALQSDTQPLSPFRLAPKPSTFHLTSTLLNSEPSMALSIDDDSDRVLESFTLSATCKTYKKRLIQ